jgi:hypothetical protein
MSAEILTVTPMSGEFPELHFGNHFNSKLWAKFVDNQFGEWVGCFSKSHASGFSVALTNHDNSKGFVVAGGQGYLIDIQERMIIKELDDQPLIESAIATTKPGYFLAGTFNSIYVLDNTGLLKEIKPDMIIDGIYFKRQINSKAIGDLATAENQYSKNVDFEFDLSTFKLSLMDSGLLGRLLRKFK